MVQRLFRKIWPCSTTPPEEDLLCLSSVDLQVRALRLELTGRIFFIFAELKGVEQSKLICVALNEHLEESLTFVCS
jgi:hypothetical protein